MAGKPVPLQAGHVCSWIFGVISNRPPRSATSFAVGPRAPSGSSKGRYASDTTGSLGVALRSEPRDLAVSVHPVVGICLADQPGNFALFATRIVCLDSPVVICNADGL